MEIFQLVKSHLVILGYSQIQSMQSHPFLNKKLLVGSLAASLNTILCCLYCFLVASGFDEYIDSFFSASGSVGIFVIFSVYVWKIEKLYQLIDQIQKTVNPSECFFTQKAIHSHLVKKQIVPFLGLEIEDLKSLYGRTNHQIENILSQISYFFFAKFTPACLCLPNFVVSYFNYFATDSGNDAFVLPIFMWFPFKWDDPIRYAIVTILQYTMVERAIIPISCTLSVVIGILLWLKTIKRDIEHGLNAIDANTKIKKKRVRIPMQLLDFVKLHTDAKQLSPNASGQFNII